MERIPPRQEAVDLDAPRQVQDVRLQHHDQIDAFGRELAPRASHNALVCVRLEREAHEPADILVNGKIVARGEIVTIDQRYGVRITAVTKTA